jgi:FkbM family methyltransferase
MIISPFKSRFEQLKNTGNHIQYVLDIGAYRGDFTETILAVWPTAVIRQIEADDRQQQWLKPGAIHELLGNTDGVMVDFYTLSEDKITTGSSIFKELTPHYNNQDTLVIKKRMTTIDALDKKHNFYGDWRNHGLLKLDTQGSELLILEGARNFLSAKAPRWILIECSVRQYNDGAPRILEVLAKLDKLSYSMYDVFDLTYDSQGRLLQSDILFERQ